MNSESANTPAPSIWVCALVAVAVAAGVMLLAVLMSNVMRVGQLVPTHAIEYFEDQAGVFDMRSVQSVPFVPLREPHRRVGYSKSVYWLKIDVGALGMPAGQPFYMALDVVPDVGDARLWQGVRTTTGYAVREQRIGIELPLSERSLTQGLAAFEIAPASSGDHHVFLRLRSRGSMYLLPRVMSHEEHEQAWVTRIAMVFCTLGALLVVLLGCMYWWRITRERQFLWLILAAVPLALAEWFSKDLGYRSFLQESPWLAVRVVPVALAIYLFCYLRMNFVLLGRTDKQDFATKMYLDGLNAASVLVLVTVGLLLALPGLFVGLTFLHASFLLGSMLLFYGWVFVVPSTMFGSLTVPGLHLVFFVIVVIRTLEDSGGILPFEPFVPSLPSPLFTLCCIGFCMVAMQVMAALYIARQKRMIKAKKNMMHLMEQEILNRTFELQRTTAQVEHRNAQIAERSAELSHELRSPLSAIIGVSKLLITQDSLSRLVRKDIETIRRIASELLGMVDEKLAEIQGDNLLEEGLSKTLVEMPVNEIVQDIRSISSWMASHHQNTFVFNSSPDLPTHLKLNERAFRQIFINLITNAGRYCENGVVTVELAFIQNLASKGDYLLLNVSDTGAGMNKTTLQGIFDRYQRARNSPGLGLGLPIVKDLVTAAGGSIEVHSERGKGTSFVVLYPASACGPSSLGTFPTSPYGEAQAVGAGPSSALSPLFSPNEFLQSVASHEERRSVEGIADIGFLLHCVQNGLYSDAEAWFARAKARCDGDDAALATLAELESLFRRMDFKGLTDWIGSGA